MWVIIYTHLKFVGRGSEIKKIVLIPSWINVPFFGVKFSPHIEDFAL